MSLIRMLRAALGATLIASLLLPAAVTAQTAPAEPAAAPAAPAAPAADAPAAADAASAAPAAPAEAPPAAEPPAPPELSPLVEKVAVDNPYGLKALWEQGDMVAKSTLIILLIMSMGSWYIIFVKLWEQRQLMKSGDAAAKDFWTTGSVKSGIAALKEGSAFRYIAETGVNASEHHEGTLVEQIDLHTWVSMSVQRAIDSIGSRMQNGLAFLATVGSTAPFVGLFGTVWGIYHALVAIGVSGQASIDKVAGPVGEALIMTAIGLAVAVPAVMGYNWLVRRNKLAMEKVRTFGSDVHNVLLAGKR